MISERIKTIRTRFSMTQAELGQKIGKTAAYVNRIEKGKAEPSETFITSISSTLNINESWLRTGSGEMMKETDLRPVSDRIRQIRMEWHESQAGFAEMLGVSRNTISLLERGKIAVSGRMIEALVEKYEIDEDWLRTGRGDMYSRKIEETVRIYEVLERDAGVRKNVIEFLWRKYREELPMYGKKSDTCVEEKGRVKNGR